MLSCPNLHASLDRHHPVMLQGVRHLLQSVVHGGFLPTKPLINKDERLDRNNIDKYGAAPLQCLPCDFWNDCFPNVHWVFICQHLTPDQMHIRIVIITYAPFVHRGCQLQPPHHSVEPGGTGCGRLSTRFHQVWPALSSAGSFLTVSLASRIISEDRAADCWWGLQKLNKRLLPLFFTGRHPSGI